MNKALIVIDVQKGFINKNTKKQASKIHNHIRKHKEDYELIIFTKFENQQNSHFVKILKWKGFMKKSETDFAHEIKEFTNIKNTFVKHTYGSFVDAKLLKVLKKNKIAQVDLVGFDTENCVLTFARDAFDRGMKVVVFKDLTASHSNLGLHKAALEIISDNIGTVK